MSVFKRWNGSSWEIIGPQISSARFDDTNHMIAPEYSPYNPYDVGDCVVQGDKLYKCISAIESTEEWTPAHWSQISMGGEISNLNNALKQNSISFYLESIHSSTVDKIGIEIASGETYYAILKTTNNIPVSGALVGWKSDGSNVTIGGIGNGSVNKYIATADFKQFSVYLGAPSTPCTVSLQIIRDNSILLLGDKFDNLRYYAVGRLDNCIMIDTVNKTITAPGGLFYPEIGSNYVLIPALPSTSIASYSNWVLLVNYDTLTYELIPYNTVKNYNGRVVAVFGPNDGYYSSPFPVKVNGYYRAEAKAIKSINNLTNSLTNSYISSWTHNSSHSSNADKVSVEIADGETFYVIVKTSNGATLTGSLQSFDSQNVSAIVSQITTNKFYEFTATRSIASFGLYLPAPSNQCEVYLCIIKEGTFLNIDQTIDGVPNYWKSTLDDAINTVAALQTYESGVTFGFITDIHWETNHQVSPMLIDYINRHSLVDMWINGGDTASGFDTKAQQIQCLFEAMGSYGHGYKFYSVNGNHDPNQGGPQLSNGILNNLIMPHYDNLTFGNGLYYWYDYRNTRFICLDTNSRGAGESDPEQIAWAMNVISNSPYPVIIVLHIVYISSTAAQPCDFFNDLITAIGTNDNVKMIIAGHLHNDRSFIASNGTPVIILDTDSRFADDGITRVKGTTSEQCLSIVTNDYINKIITVTRIGSIKTSFTVEY